MKKTFLLLMTPFLCSPAVAAEIETESDIFAVTVFPDRADVSRMAVAELPAGKHTLTFNNLPDGLRQDSLRVSGKGNASFAIGSVETRQIFITAPAADEEHKIHQQLTALRDKRRFIESEIKAADTGKAFLENLTRGNANIGGTDGKKPETMPPAVWQNAWKTIQNGMNTLGKESIEKQIALRSIDDEINALQNKQHQIATGRRSYKQVRVNVETDKPVKAKITVQYQISGASWRPLYEARLDSAKENVNIVQYGSISQHTGEDWNNVALTLSTARPYATTQPPVLQPVWLDLRTQQPVMRKQMRLMAAARGPMRVAESNFAADSVAMDAVAEEEMELAAIAPTAEAVGTDFSGVFEIKGTSNVPADGSEYRFNIGDYVNTAEIRAETYPATDMAAYLIATTSYNGRLPLLAGNIALFRDGAFIGNSYMELLRPNEKLHLAFGQDDKIRVTHTALGGETSEGNVIVRDTKKDVLSKTSVQNLHRQPVKIAVYEQLPVSRNSDISVKVIKDKTTAGYVESPNDKVGVVKWESVYQPQEKRDITYGYTISWPKDRILTGI